MRIFLDVDDTLNSFTMFVLHEYFGVANHEFGYYEFPCPGEYDIIKAHRLLSGLTIPDSIFWDSLPEWCWSDAPLSREFDLILDIAEKLAPPEQIFLATDLTKSPRCASGKLKWIQNKLPEYLHRNYFLTPRKGELAKPGDLLIDDSERACKKFEANGGSVLLVPRPWNKLHEECTIDVLTTYMRNI